MKYDVQELLRMASDPQVAPNHAKVAQQVIDNIMKDKLVLISDEVYAILDYEGDFYRKKELTAYLKKKKSTLAIEKSIMGEIEEMWADGIRDILACSDDYYLNEYEWDEENLSALEYYSDTTKHTEEEKAMYGYSELIEKVERIKMLLKEKGIIHESNNV